MGLRGNPPFIIASLADSELCTRWTLGVTEIAETSLNSSAAQVHAAVAKTSLEGNANNARVRTAPFFSLGAFAFTSASDRFVFPPVFFFPPELHVEFCKREYRSPYANP